MTRAVDIKGRGVRVNGRSVGIGSATPDSAFSQFQIDEGSGSTLNNEFSGQPDATINGADWASKSDAVGGYELDFVSSNSDNVDINSTYSEIDDGSDWSFAITVSMDDLSTIQTIWEESDGTVTLTVGTDVGDSGQFAVMLYDAGSSSVIDRVAEGSLATTSRVRLGVGFDASNSRLEIRVDGTEGSDRFNSNPNGSTGTSGNKLGSRVDDQSFADMRCDNPIWYSSLLSDSEWDQDYNNQPWS